VVRDPVMPIDIAKAAEVEMIIQATAEGMREKEEMTAGIVGQEVVHLKAEKAEEGTMINAHGVVIGIGSEAGAELQKITRIDAAEMTGMVMTNKMASTRPASNSVLHASGLVAYQRTLLSERLNGCARDRVLCKT